MAVTFNPLPLTTPLCSNLPVGAGTPRIQNLKVSVPLPRSRKATNPGSSQPLHRFVHACGPSSEPAHRCGNCATPQLQFQARSVVVDMEEGVIHKMLKVTHMGGGANQPCAPLGGPAHRCRKPRRLRLRKHPTPYCDTGAAS